MFHDREKCTSAGDSSVLMMTAVVFAPGQAFASSQVRFRAVAVDVVQENPTRSVAKVRVSVCVDGIATA